MQTSVGKVCYPSSLVTKSSRVERQSGLNESLYQLDWGRGIGYGGVTRLKGPPSKVQNARIAGKTKKPVRKLLGEEVDLGAR